MRESKWNALKKKKQVSPFLHVTHLLDMNGPGSVAQSDARSTGDQEGVSSRLRSGNILSLRLIMISFLRSFSPFRCFKKGSCQLLAKECALSTG